MFVCMCMDLFLYVRLCVDNIYVCGCLFWCSCVLRVIRLFIFRMAPTNVLSYYYFFSFRNLSINLFLFLSFSLLCCLSFFTFLLLCPHFFDSFLSLHILYPGATPCILYLLPFLSSSPPFLYYDGRNYKNKLK